LSDALRIFSKQNYPGGIMIELVRQGAGLITSEAENGFQE
jgi:hypothetical protein